MKYYQEKIQAARRQAILLALHFAPGYTLNRAVLREQVEHTGYVCSADLFITELNWLVEMGYIASDDTPDVYRLTERGSDIALGHTQVPGVRRPSPGEIDHGSR